MSRASRCRNTAAIAAAVLALVPALPAQQQSQPAASAVVAPEVLLLARIKNAMKENLTRLPNYTCLETVERSVRRANQGRFELIDRLRLEVAMVNGREMYAWPGAKGFEDKPLTEMVGRDAGGAIGTGGFGQLALAVFTGSGPMFRYVGEIGEGGRKLLRYDFHVPLMSSGYNIRVWGKGSAVTAYRGSVWADPETLDLARLEVQAVDIPPQLELSAATDLLSYSRVKIGESTFLLPASSELSLVDIAGNVNRNRVQLSGCRQYSGESVVHFDEVTLDSPAAAPTSSALPSEVPQGMLVQARLTDEIVESHVAVGDPVSAQVVSPARLNRRVVIPKGALLAGRITRLERHEFGGRNVFIVAMDFTAVSYEGALARAAFLLEEAPPNLGVPVGVSHADVRFHNPGPNAFFVFQPKLRLLKGMPLLLRTVPLKKENP
jgi:hypothetical protein